MGRTRCRRPGLSEPIRTRWENQINRMVETKPGMTEIRFSLIAVTLIFPTGSYGRVSRPPASSSYPRRHPFLKLGKIHAFALGGFHRAIACKFGIFFYIKIESEIKIKIKKKETRI